MQAPLACCTDTGGGVGAGLTRGGGGMGLKQRGGGGADLRGWGWRALAVLHVLCIATFH